MLTDDDIQFIKQTRKEIIAKRTEPVTLIYERVVSRDPFTGEEETEEMRINVDAIVTELSGEDRVLNDGVSVEKGDIQFSVDFDLIADNYDQFVNVEHDGKKYTILAADKKGIGAANRVEFLARKTN